MFDCSYISYMTVYGSRFKNKTPLEYKKAELSQR